MTTIVAQRLYRVLDVPAWPNGTRPPELEPGTIVWCHCSRPSSIGGYIGTYSRVYRQINGFSPHCRTWQMKTDCTEPIEQE